MVVPDEVVQWNGPCRVQFRGSIFENSERLDDETILTEYPTSITANSAIAP